MTIRRTLARRKRARAQFGSTRRHTAFTVAIARSTVSSTPEIASGASASVPAGSSATLPQASVRGNRRAIRCRRSPSWSTTAQTSTSSIRRRAGAWNRSVTAPHPMRAIAIGRRRLDHDQGDAKRVHRLDRYPGSTKPRRRRLRRRRQQGHDLARHVAPGPPAQHRAESRDPLCVALDVGRPLPEPSS